MMKEQQDSKGQAFENLKRFILNIPKSLREDEVQFRLATTFKISIIPIFTMSILGVFLHTVLKLNLMYFQANGFDRIVGLQEAYYDYILSTLLDLIPYLALILIGIVFMGMYLSHMLLRPFRNIGSYCDKINQGQDAIYNPDFLADLAVLTGFCEYFFNIMENAKKYGSLTPMEVPKKFTRIHKPVFEKTFFLQYSFFLIITSIALATAIYAVTTDVYDHMIALSIETLKHGHSMTFFLKQQEKIIEDVVTGVMISHMILYALLAFHLYRKVSVPAFGFFATMRSFMKGSYSTRVHMIGHNYIRPEGRKLNRYLENLQQNLTGNNERVHNIESSRKAKAKDP